jgi:hypothetical protein
MRHTGVQRCRVATGDSDGMKVLCHTLLLRLLAGLLVQREEGAEQQLVQALQLNALALVE